MPRTAMSLGAIGMIEKASGVAMQDVAGPT